MTFSYDNTSLGQDLNLSYFVANLSSSATVSPASILFGSMGLDVLRQPGYTLLNGAGQVSHVFHVLEKIKMNLNSILAVAEAVDINKEYTGWLNTLNELQDCAENPTNPVTINGYEQNPGQEQQILDQISSAKSQLAELTIARFVNLVVGLGSEVVKSLGVDVIAVIAEHYSEHTLKQLSEEQVQNIEKLVTPCQPTTTTATSSTITSSSTTTTLTVTSTSSSSTETGSSASLSPVSFTGSFQWKTDTGSGEVSMASGTFAFTIDLATALISGSGNGLLTVTLGSPDPCSGQGSSSYTFNVTGVYYRSANSLGLIFGNAYPPGSFTETCPNFTNQVPFGEVTPVLPTQYTFPAVDGASVECPGSSCPAGPSQTYKVTIHVTGFETSTFSIQSSVISSSETTITTTSTPTSSETQTSSETSSQTSGTTLTISTSNSTSTSTG